MSDGPEPRRTGRRAPLHRSTDRSRWSFTAWRARHKAKLAARSKLRRRLTRGAIGIVVVVIVLVGAGVGYTIYHLNELHRLPGKGLASDSSTGGIEDILLIGSTNRCALKVQNPAYGLCSQGVNGINSDVVMILRLDPKDNRVSLLSIPRDTFVPDARSGGSYNKIDAALYDGPDHLAQAIEEDFGIPINHFVVLNFDTFADVVNALGGIHLYFPDRLYDANSGLDIKHTGCIYLNGVQALEVVRSRHLYYFTKGETPNITAIRDAALDGSFVTSDAGGTYDGSGDLGRIERDHLFLEALASAVAKRGLGNIATDNALISAVAPDLTVDSTLGDDELLHLIIDFHGINLSKVPELTAPIISDADTYLYEGYDYGDVVFPAEPQDEKTIEDFMGGPPKSLSLKPSSISVSVVDGAGSPQVTATTQSELGAIGYKMVATDATDYVGPIAETTVLYKKGDLAEAERVEANLSGTVVLGQGTPSAGADVSVVAGSNFNVVATPTTTTTAKKPKRSSTSTTSTTAPVTTTTTVPATTTTVPNPDVFSPVTKATEPIPSWDPRACPAS